MVTIHCGPKTSLPRNQGLATARRSIMKNSFNRAGGIGVWPSSKAQAQTQASLRPSSLNQKAMNFVVSILFQPFVFPSRTPNLLCTIGYPGGVINPQSSSSPRKTNPPYLNYSQRNESFPALSCPQSLIPSFSFPT